MLQACGPVWPDLLDEELLQEAPCVAASPSILHALAALLQEPCSSLSLCSLLERYREALCAACVEPQCIAATLEAWHCAFQDLHEGIPLLAAALHGRAIDWVREAWSVDWLIGADSSPGERMPTAICRQSCSLLDALDFGLDADIASSAFCAEEGFLLFSEAARTVLDAQLTGWHDVAIIRGASADCDWLRLAHALAMSSSTGTFTFCLPDLNVASCFEAVQHEPAFDSLRRRQVVLQDVLLVLVQLWKADLAMLLLSPGVMVIFCQQCSDCLVPAGQSMVSFL